MKKNIGINIEGFSTVKASCISIPRRFIMPAKIHSLLKYWKFGEQNTVVNKKVDD